MPDAARGPESRLARWAPLSAAGIVFCALLLSRATYTVDDAFIAFRYARNWALTGIPRFNPGVVPPVEGYSDFLWVALLAGARTLGAALPQTALVLGGLFGASTLALWSRVLRRETGARGWRAFMGLSLVATAPAFVVGSSGGLETALFTFLITASFATLTTRSPEGERADDERGEVRVGVLAGLLTLGVALVRVEGFLWVLAIVGAVAVTGPRLRARRFPIALGVYLLGFSAFLLWRHGVYGEWLSNSARAKAGLSAERALRGGRYVASWALSTWTPLAALCVLPLALRAGRAVSAALVLALAFAAFAVVVGGDWMPYWRFLAPAAPFLALVVTAGLVRMPRAAGTVLGLALVAVQALPLFGISAAPTGALEALRYRGFRGPWKSEAQRLDTARTNGEHFAALGRALDEALEGDESLVFGAIGAVGWYAPDLFLHDRNGLVDREVAQLDAASLQRLGAGAKTAGHDRRLPRAWFLHRSEPREPTFFHATLVDGRLPGPGSAPFRAAVTAAMNGQILSQSGEEALLDSTVVEARPVSGGRTLLLWRRAPDEAAAHRFWRKLGLGPAQQ